MPLNWNYVTLGGCLTRDPEIRYTPANTAIVKFGLAANRFWKDPNGVQKEEVLFIDVDAFGKTGELIAKHFKKGSPLLFGGRLKLDQWDDKTTGKKQSKIKAVLEQFSFVEFKGADGDRPTAPTPAPRTAAPGATPAPVNDNDDTAPF